MMLYTQGPPKVTQTDGPGSWKREWWVKCRAIRHGLPEMGNELDLGESGV